MGKTKALISQQEAFVNKIEQSIFKKVHISPVNLSKCLYTKDFRSFHPSLNLSHHLSHISPIDWSVDGRDMGEIRNNPPVLKFLCTKVFQEI